MVNAINEGLKTSIVLISSIVMQGSKVEKRIDGAIGEDRRCIALQRRITLKASVTLRTDYASSARFLGKLSHERHNKLHLQHWSWQPKN